MGTIYVLDVTHTARGPMLPCLHSPLPAGIRSRCLCAQGDVVGAVAVARHGLTASQHDSLASFLHLQGGVPGAHLALMGLQGLSLEMEAELCMATGQWNRTANRCVRHQSASVGCSTRCNEGTQLPVSTMHQLCSSTAKC